MATKRQRLTRNVGQRVTPEARAIFREALPLQEWANNCLASDRMCTHESCDRYRELSVALMRELHLKVFETNPLEVELGDDPPSERDGSAWAQSWPRAMELRRELENG